MKIPSPLDLEFVRRVGEPSERSISVSRVLSHQKGVAIDWKHWLVSAELISR